MICLLYSFFVVDVVVCFFFFFFFFFFTVCLLILLTNYQSLRVKNRLGQNPIDHTVSRGPTVLLECCNTSPKVCTRISSVTRTQNGEFLEYKSPVIMIMSRYLCVFYKPLNSDVDYRHVIFDMLTCCVLKTLLHKATSGELLAHMGFS